MTAQASRGATLGRRALARVRAEVRLTGLAIWRGALSFYDSEDLTFAASIAYYSLLSLFPFLLLAVSIIATLTSTEGDRKAVLDFVLQYFPRQFPFVTRQLEAMQRAPSQLTAAGSLLLIWAAMGVFGAITSAINHAWGVEKQPSFFKHKLISFIMLVAASLLLLVALLVVTAASIAEAGWFASVLARAPALEALQILDVLRSFAVRWATTFTFIIVVGLVYYFVPNARVRFRDVWVGAIVTGLLWRAAFAGFSFYVRDISRFESIHGSLAAVVVFLFWIYTSAVILLFGAELTAAYARLRRHRPEEIPAAPAPRL